MIESRIKRALWAASVLIAMGFGGHSAYMFAEAKSSEAAGQRWNTLNGAFIAECERGEHNPDIGNVCHDAYEMRTYYLYAPNRAVVEAGSSLGIAVGTPIALWTLFFLLRWIWTGRVRNSQSLAVEKRAAQLVAPVDPPQASGH